MIEVNDDQIEELYNEEIDGSKKIGIVKRQVMEHLQSVEEARYYVEQMKKEVRTDIEEKAALRMDPNGIQDDDDCEEEGMEEHDDYQYCDPAMIEQDEMKYIW